jgi:diaminohydroxyphosphoribosylaminopyrimidine deaminase/5-amino-6-(5-phosphoribosylamino)uracil reductase
MNLRLPTSLQLFNQEVKTIVFNVVKHEEEDNQLFYKIEKDKSGVQQILHALYQLRIQSVLVEGGAKLLQSFIDEGLWDEARIITNTDLHIENGLAAPVLKPAEKTSEESILTDKIETYISK